MLGPTPFEVRMVKKDLGDSDRQQDLVPVYATVTYTGLPWPQATPEKKTGKLMRPPHIPT